jgi:hypothetical protein
VEEASGAKTGSEMRSKSWEGSLWRESRCRFDDKSNNGRRYGKRYATEQGTRALLFFSRYCIFRVIARILFDVFSERRAACAY